ncbi:MAG: glycosyl hydrolase [Cyanothece sp. SIO1E1]|nr:glycosyl hydrolase [Cyanothece sp. SIO1E1]
MRNHFYTLLCLALIVCIQPAWGQNRAKKNKKKKAEVEAPAAPTFDAKMYKSLKWRNIGPFRGGRANAVAGVVGSPNLYYVGYTGGGVWKTIDGGLHWKNISDGSLKSGSVGDIAVAASDPNVIFVGMGEHAVRGVMTTYGDGVYKSIDGGKSWKHMGLEKTRHISDVVIHPTNPDIVYVAAQGALHGPSEERGIYKSTDGGASWKKVLYVDENSGASSLSMDQTNPRILYAATWDHRREPWTVRSGGPGSGVYKSNDGGETWRKIESGLPKDLGKIGISVSKANPSRVYAIVESEKKEAGLYRSDNGGGSWKHMTNDQLLTARSWYYMEVFADPVNADVVYVLNAPMMRSIDGGKSFSRISVGHGDTHDLWINPDDNTNMILGDDGGAEITYNTGASWSPQNNQPTAQFYRVNADKQFPYKVYGGQQDNSSVVISSRTNGRGITDKDWTRGPGCESAYIAFDPDNPRFLYGGCYQGIIEVLDMETGEGKDIMEYASLNFAVKPKDLKYRFNWNAPIIASPHDPSTIYHAGNVVFKTSNGGMDWEVISPDLTRNDTTKQDVGGGPFTNEGAGGENYNTIYYLIESSLERGVMYSGSDCGLVHVTKDGGKNWSNITPPDLAESMIQSIEVSPHAPGTAYIAATRYKFNDFSPLSYKTTDYGKTWTMINAGIDKDDFLKVIREDPRQAGLLYGGAERGFYISFDGGEKWDRLQLNLPVVPVTDLIIRDNDLVAATQGRAFWILDDLSALQESKGEQPEGLVDIMTPKQTVRFSGGSSAGAGANPKAGVILDYYLGEDIGDEEVRLDIMNADGEIVRSYSSIKDKEFKPYPGGPPAPTVLPAKKGFNRFAWDFRTETLPDVPNVFIYGSYRGHQVAPGNYSARISFKDQAKAVDIHIKADPRLAVEKGTWKQQQEILDHTVKQISAIHAEVNSMRQLRDQIQAYNKILGDNASHEDLVKLGKELVEKIDKWEGQVVETRQKSTQDVINWPSKLNAAYFYLRGRLDEHDPRVTQGVRNRLSDLDQEWATYKKESTSLLQNEVQAFNELFKKKAIPALIIDNKARP